ncbi:hypothetical protein SKAU_G00396510 [Synaphobranchus kaupii]|uniref:Uncharacterized protein n=1 Tax=Synaphobranchus kaupii TaxID=118154 RepID=A0A9Q1ECN6_SYNKA|nr:hypothetical protein SKAU_G00396510 [Synaphobranchus kaupii]
MDHPQTADPDATPTGGRALKIPGDEFTWRRRTGLNKCRRVWRKWAEDLGVRRALRKRTLFRRHGPRHGLADFFRFGGVGRTRR